MSRAAEYAAYVTRRQAAIVERTRIVAWLRSDDVHLNPNEAGDEIEAIASRIERGEHEDYGGSDDSPTAVYDDGKGAAEHLETKEREQ